MAGLTLGPDHELAIRLQKIEDAVKDLATRDVLQSANIGAGGLTVNGGNITIASGGSLIVTGTGTISLATGAFNANLITSNTDVNATGNFNVGGYVFTPAGYAYDITYTRRAAWLGNDGRLGWASSSITAKELLDTIPEPDALRILEITSHHYERKAELAKRDDPKSADYVGPDYHVSVEWGAIAEELHALGLWQVVIYEWDVKYELQPVLDENGKMIVDGDGQVLKVRVGHGERIGEGKPIGVHYELLGLLAIVASRYVWAQHLTLEARVAKLEARQGL